MAKAKTQKPKKKGLPTAEFEEVLSNMAQVVNALQQMHEVADVFDKMKERYGSQDIVELLSPSQRDEVEKLAERIRELSNRIGI